MIELLNPLVSILPVAKVADGLYFSILSKMSCYGLNSSLAMGKNTTLFLNYPKIGTILLLLLGLDKYRCL